jgi:hypothetical protein
MDKELWRNMLRFCVCAKSSIGRMLVNFGRRQKSAELRRCPQVFGGGYKQV